MTQPSTLNVRLLGDFSVLYGDEPVAGINTPRLQSLFAYLVLHRGAPQLRQHLAFLFWPDTGETQARTNLRQLLHQLRQALPDAERFLHADAHSIAWQPAAPIRLDVAEFEQALALADAAKRADEQVAGLERAIELYRADLLPSCYDDWIVHERERLQQQQWRALARQIGRLEARHEYAAAIRHAWQLVRGNPLDEAVYRDLMRLLMLNSDRAGALRAYQACAAALRRELGVEPSQETREAYERLVQRDAPQSQRRLNRDPALPLIGRQHEWEQMQAAWRRAAAGEAGMMLVTGEAGIGKSRLAEELSSWAVKQGIGVAKTRSYAAEGQLSLAPVIDWLRSDTLQPHLAQLGPIWRSEITRILPELLALEPDLPPYEPLTEFGQRQRFFEALARAVLAAQQPLLLMIDDLQWCDLETIEWLHFLLRFDPQARLLVVGTVRDEEVAPQHPLSTLLIHLRGTAQITELALPPLDAAETAKLAQHVGGRKLDTDSTMWLFHETEGNPLFVVETIRSGDTGWVAELGRYTLDSHPQPLLPIPRRVQAVIAGRLAQLSTPARELAALAAAIGRAFTLDLLIQASRSDEDSVVRALDELWQHRIVREHSANSYDFTHDKLREVAYAEIHPPQRRLLHRRIAQALEQATGDEPTAISGQIAWQRERAGEAEQAIAHYQRAAVVAQRLYANEDAIALLSRGLALLDQLPARARRDTQELSLQLALAPLYRMTKGWTSPEVEHTLARALALCSAVGDDVQRAQVCYGLQSLFVVQARLEKVQEISDELQQLYQRTHGTPPPLVAGMMQAGSRMHLGRLGEAHSEFDRIIATYDPTQLQRFVEKQGWNYAVHARAWHAHTLWLLGYPEAALRSTHTAVQLANDLSQPFNQALAATYQAMLQQFCADEATARSYADQALALTTEYKAPYYRSWSAVLAAYARACEQPGLAGIEQLRQAISAFKATGARLRLPYYFGLLAHVCGLAGRPEDGLAAIGEGVAAAQIHDECWWDAELQRLRGELLLQAGADVQAAETAFLRAIEIARVQQARALELRATTSLAKLRRRQQRTEDARDLLGGVYSWFTEGFETSDLQIARALLA